jgi:NADH-quinone oxidoreductase subunit N
VIPSVPAYFLEIAVVALGLVLLLADAFGRGTERRWIGWTGIVSLLLVFALNLRATGGTEGIFWNYYAFGPGTFAAFFKGVALLATVFVLLLGLHSTRALREGTVRGHTAAEFFILPLFTCAGLMWAASASDLVSVFVSIELVTISFYVLVAYLRRNIGSLEAGVKYLVLGALSTGFMVYGISWIFGASGTTQLAELSARMAHGEVHPEAALFGFVLLLAALGFKVGAFPFSVWVPDVYQGAPTPVTAYLATASKAAGFIVLVRVLEPFFPGSHLVAGRVGPILLTLAGATLLYGSLAALAQTNVKRLLAYSGIAQAGFLLLALACPPEEGLLGPRNVVAFGLGSYLLMATLAFAVVTVVREHVGGEDLAAFKGLARRSPFLAFALLVAMAGLAGVPLTSGFVTKALVFWFAAKSQAWFLLGVGVVAGAAGFYYYFKVLRAAYMQAAPAGSAEPIALPPVLRGVLAALIVAILWLGVAPSPLLQLPAAPSEPVSEPTVPETPS